LELDGPIPAFEFVGMTLAKVQEGAMRLTARERAELLDWLWESLQPEAAMQIQERWAAEAEERIDAVDRGGLSTIDGPTAMEDLRRSLGA
jgi:putative addiction module component (TIGR02574 family)